jgi:hypothetical protein
VTFPSAVSLVAARGFLVPVQRLLAEWRRRIRRLASMGRAWPLWLGGFLFLFAAVASVTLGEPYHYDTAAYMRTVQHFLSTGEISSFFASRPVAGYAFVPLATVCAEGTLRVTASLAYAGSVTLACLLFQRLLGSGAAVAGVVAAAATPAASMTATHGKEDFVALLFVMLAALLQLRGSRLQAALGGAVFGLALLTKEVSLIVLPFVVGLALLSPASGASARRRLVLAGLTVAGSLATLLVVSPGYAADLLALMEAPSMGQFSGVLSEQLPIGLRAWRRGVGDVFVWASAAGLATPLLVRSTRCRRMAVFSLAQAVLLGIFLTNITTIRYRLFLWPTFFALPVAAVGVERLLEIVFARSHRGAVVARTLVYAAAASAALGSLQAALPVILFRHAYNPVARFYSGIRLDPRSTVVFGMDDCMHAVYFAGLECRTHPVHPDARAAELFSERVESLLEGGRSVYLLPDFFSYDRMGTLLRAMSRRFALRPVGERWYEDYHAMDFGLRPAELLRLLGEEHRGCAVDVAKRAAAAEIAAPVEVVEFGIHCPGRPDRALSFAMTRGRVLPGLRRDALLRVVPADPEPLGEDPPRMRRSS